MEIDGVKQTLSQNTLCLILLPLTLYDSFIPQQSSHLKSGMLIRNR